MSNFVRKIPGYLVLVLAVLALVVLGNWVDTLFTGKWYIDGPLWLVFMTFAFAVGYYAQAAIKVVDKRMTRDKEES